jgi:hypothetical protein
VNHHLRCLRRRAIVHKRCGAYSVLTYVKSYHHQHEAFHWSESSAVVRHTCRLLQRSHLSGLCHVISTLSATAPYQLPSPVYRQYDHYMPIKLSTVSHSLAFLFNVFSPDSWYQDPPTSYPSTLRVCDLEV